MSATPRTNLDSTEAELENFRQQWREEVQKKAKGKEKATSPETTRRHSHASSSRPHISKHSGPGVHGHARQRSIEEIDEVEPHAYPDLGDKQHGRRLDETSVPAAAKEPRTALEHYERAVEREGAGKLGDSVDLYRKAFKLDSNVHQAYKNKHFPASSFPPKPTPSNINPSNAAATVPSTAHHSSAGLPPTLQSLLEEFSTLSITGQPAPTDLSPAPPCPIAAIPDEILSEILLYVGIADVASLGRLAQVCKRLAYLVTTEERVWRRIATGSEVGFGAMHYAFACDVDGKPLSNDDDDDDDDDKGGYPLGASSPSSSSEDLLSTPPDDQPAPQDQDQDPALLTTLLVPNPYPTFHALFRQRPRIRFNGCYISTVNYTRPGASSTNSLTWDSPIHIVTYYRYLRFLRDGTCISLLSTAEPADVVPYLHTEHMHRNHAPGLPSKVMSDALLGRWRLSGPAVPGVAKPGAAAGTKGEGAVLGADVEKEGILHVETAGVTPKYMYKMVLALGSAGRKGPRNNKLSWQGYWSYNRLTDDWAEFGLKNDRPYYWSRVRSWA